MGNYIPVVTKGSVRKVNTDEVLYFEQRQRRLAIVTIDGTYVFYARMENFEYLLDERFYHALKKLVINLDKIIVVEEQTLVFEGGARITLGKENYIRAKQTFSKYLRNTIQQ